MRAIARKHFLPHTEIFMIACINFKVWTGIDVIKQQLLLLQLFLLLFEVTTLRAQTSTFECLI